MSEEYPYCNCDACRWAKTNLVGETNMPQKEYLRYFETSYGRIYMVRNNESGEYSFTEQKDKATKFTYVDNPWGWKHEEVIKPKRYAVAFRSNDASGTHYFLDKRGDGVWEENAAIFDDKDQAVKHLAYHIATPRLLKRVDWNIVEV